jgi:hypothetical protein
MFVIFKHTSSKTEEGVLQNTSDTHTHTHIISSRAKENRSYHTISYFCQKRKPVREKPARVVIFVFQESKHIFSLCLPAT